MKTALRVLIFFLLSFSTASAQTKLSVDYIMRDPKWMGVQPDDIRWDPAGKQVLFSWKSAGDTSVAVYRLHPGDQKPTRLSAAEEAALDADDGTFDKKHTRYLSEKNGAIFLTELKSGRRKLLLQSSEGEQHPAFTVDEQAITFNRGDDLYRYSLVDGSIVQLVHFVREASATKKNQPKTAQDKWLSAEQEELFVTIRRRDSLAKDREKKKKSGELFSPHEIVTGGRAVNGVQLSPDGRYITYRLIRFPEGNQTANVPEYVTASGYTENIPARTKVGSQLAAYESFVYDTKRDSSYAVSVREIPGIKDLPGYLKEYPEQLRKRQAGNKNRAVVVHGPFWNESGTLAVVVVAAQDNKDRWIMRLDPQSGKLSMLDRQHDEAWIGGPGIGSWYSSGRIGWVDDASVYFQSEATGYSHLYMLNVKTGVKTARTSGNWEVQTLQLSSDKKHFYYTANTEHPGITHFYRLPVSGGKAEKLTTMKGENEVSLSPDEKWLAIRYSYSNKPWELYVQSNRPGVKARQLTYSTSPEFRNYAWRDPEMITFKNRYGKTIYARLYQPKKGSENKAAVIFVHGAGYLQNVHFGWSSYFREYMFHNLLADQGYSILDIDYTGSAGYGRDHRTGIYRHMGGKDLDDQVDGAKLLVERYGIDAKRIGMYGGSYGGFMTLMALFTQPDVFGAGAALRSVTDWAHYNQGYTANILNDPADDEKAYRKSSPIYFAGGLTKPLLMCHGMVDVNVHYQDIVRLSQRLIELKKENWQLASYPVEDHAFVEPESWTDEYKRIFNLFESTIGKR